ncbi:hypothetical protein C8J56DRAFT_954154 [Mycena floridula]|nr:hypothetical protein C8J56DRAFT_954154 [Mycena floridula]
MTTIPTPAQIKHQTPWILASMRILPYVRFFVLLSGLAFILQSVSGFMDLANQAVIGQSTPLFWNQPVGTTITLQLVCETCSNDATSSLPPIDVPQGSLSGTDTIVFSSALQPGTYHILAQTGQTSDNSQTHSFQLVSGDGTTPSNPTNAANPQTTQTSKASTGAGQGSTTTNLKASGTGTAVPGQPATSTSSSSSVGSGSGSDSGNGTRNSTARSHSSASVTLSTLPGGAIVTIGGSSSSTAISSTSIAPPNASTTLNPGSHHLPAGALGGIIAGMLMLFALFALILVCWLRRRSQRSKRFTSNPFSDKLVDHPARPSSFIEPAVLPQDSTQSSTTIMDEKPPVLTTDGTQNHDTSESPSPFLSDFLSSSAPSQGVSSSSDATVDATRSNATIDVMAAEMERMKAEIDWLKNQHMVEQLPPAYS